VQTERQSLEREDRKKGQTEPELWKSSKILTKGVPIKRTQIRQSNWETNCTDLKKKKRKRRLSFEGRWGSKKEERVTRSEALDHKEELEEKKKSRSRTAEAEKKREKSHSGRKKRLSKREGVHSSKKRPPQRKSRAVSKAKGGEGF